MRRSVIVRLEKLGIVADQLLQQPFSTKRCIYAIGFGKVYESQISSFALRCKAQVVLQHGLKLASVSRTL